MRAKSRLPLLLLLGVLAGAVGFSSEALVGQYRPPHLARPEAAPPRRQTELGGEPSLPETFATSFPLPSRQEHLFLVAGPLPGRSRADPAAIAKRLAFLAPPIAGSRLTAVPDSHLPGAPRAYRGGWHQGIDYYDSWCGVPIVYGVTEVRAAGPGVVARVDTEFLELTRVEREALLAELLHRGHESPVLLDLLHGRQVWIAHGGGVLTRYSHLAGVDPGLVPGAGVKAGQLLGWVGNSGTSAGAAARRDGAHLHFEIHLDGAPFWLGLSLPDIRAVLQEVLRPDEGRVAPVGCQSPSGGAFSERS
ncbi:MAG TPA: M23 family metallopeptidase [Bacillota bacterium]|nr:M23 family metallopeptidase [Bacillota bacterium]